MRRQLFQFMANHFFANMYAKKIWDYELIQQFSQRQFVITQFDNLIGYCLTNNANATSCIQVQEDVPKQSDHD